jgi:hypothetical protein
MTSAPGKAETAGVVITVVGGSVVDTGDGIVVCNGPCGEVFIHPEQKRITMRIPMAAEK